MMINKYKNIPNFITIAGLLIVNYSLLMYNLTSNIIYLLYMIIGFSCDYLDGYLARKYKTESDVGNILDKIVDKINQLFLLITLINKSNVSKLYLLLFCLRKIIMYLLRKFNLKKVKSSIHGKIKTFIFPLSLIFFHMDIFFKYIFLNLLTVYNFITLFL